MNLWHPTAPQCYGIEEAEEEEEEEEETTLCSHG